MLLLKSLLASILVKSSEAECCEKTTVSKSGITCQRWDKNFPHRVRFKPDNFENNNCAVAHPKDTKPWCYLDDYTKRWEHCNCEVCGDQEDESSDSDNSESSEEEILIEEEILVEETKPVAHCTTTASGRMCQKWSVNFPHKPNFRPENPNNNFCANPDGDEKLWCHTTDPRKRWEYCDENCSATSNGGFGSSGHDEPAMECGVTIIPFGREKGQKHPSNFGETGECKPPSCSVCELSENMQKNRNRRQAQKAEVISTRIFGGTGLKRGQAPWQVSLRGPSGCGGTLISMEVVVTASHCLDNANPPDWRLQAGHIERYERDLKEMPGTVQMRNVVKIIKHENYNRGARYNNDIALMFADEPFEYTDYVRPACLPTASFDFEEGHMIISGLGKTEKGWIEPMNYATIPMCNQKACKDRFRGMYRNETMICGGLTGKDSCQGDSGGPLIATIDKKFTLVGVTSWGIGCGLQNYPGIYTKMTNYLQWINDKIN